jgi:anti-sigma B factor antagonist
VTFQRDLRDLRGVADGPASLSVTVVRRPDGITRVLAVGEIDWAAAEKLDQAIEHEPAAGTRALLVDLSRVPFCSSPGLHLLVGLRRRADAAGVPLELVVATAAVRRVLRAAGLWRLFSTHDTVAAALAKLGVERE